MDGGSPAHQPGLLVHASIWTARPGSLPPTRALGEVHNVGAVVFETTTSCPPDKRARPSCATLRCRFLSPCEPPARDVRRATCRRSLVGLARFERTTSSSRTRRPSKLGHNPLYSGGSAILSYTLWSLPGGLPDACRRSSAGTEPLRGPGFGPGSPRIVELRGFEPRTFSVRTNCTTGLCYSPEVRGTLPLQDNQVPQDEPAAPRSPGRRTLSRAILPFPGFDDPAPGTRRVWSLGDSNS